MIFMNAGMKQLKLQTECSLTWRGRTTSVAMLCFLDGASSFEDLRRTVLRMTDILPDTSIPQCLQWTAGRWIMMIVLQEFVKPLWAVYWMLFLCKATSQRSPSITSGRSESDFSSFHKGSWVMEGLAELARTTQYYEKGRWRNELPHSESRS